MKAQLRFVHTSPPLIGKTIDVNHCGSFFFKKKVAMMAAEPH